MSSPGALRADAVFLIFGKSYRPEISLLTLATCSGSIGRATRRVTRCVSVGLSRTCWRRHANQDAGF